MLLVAENVGEFWTYYISGLLLPGTGGPDFYPQGDEVVRDLVETWAVEWLEPEEEAIVERRELDLRDDWKKYWERRNRKRFWQR